MNKIGDQKVLIVNSENNIKNLINEKNQGNNL